MSFDTEVSLSLTVSQRELRSVRSDIEGGLGDIELGVSGGGGQASAGGGQQNQNRRLFRWARQRTRDMDTTVTLLESINDTLEDGGTGGGGGGGGGGLVPIPSGALGKAAGAAGTAASAAGTAVSGLGLSGAAALGAPLLGAAGGAAILLATGRNMEAMEDFRQERQRRREQGSLNNEGRLGPPGGNDAFTGGGDGPNFSQTLVDLASGNIEAPAWANQMVSGQFTAPEWANMLISAQTPTAEQTPTGMPTSQVQDIPGRVKIDFDTTVESQFGMTPQELRDKIEEVSEEKADELRRELARATGRGTGGTPIP